MKNPRKTANPVIGITLDYEESGGYSKMPWYALRENYCSAVSRFGALPLPLPHELDKVETYLDMLGGLVITGGAFDVSPQLYGESGRHETVTTKDRRTQFEFAMTRGAIERKMPVLGICGGQQLLNVVLGGTLIQHIPDAVKNALEHEQKNPRTEPGHEVRVVEGTLLHHILTSPSPLVGEGRGEGVSSKESLSKIPPLPNPLPRGGRGLIIAVNSAHHQAVAKPAPGAIVNALAPDGVIEGIELPATVHPFCLGVQWHPEYFVTAADENIFEAFVNAAVMSHRS